MPAAARCRLRLERLDSRDVPTVSTAQLAQHIIDSALPNGGIRSRTGPGAYGPDASGPNAFPEYLVDPYFADLAVAGLVKAPPTVTNRLAVARNYLQWRLDNTDAQGLIDRHWYFASGATARIDGATGRPLKTAIDAEDSAAATFLYAVNEYAKAGGATDFLLQPRTLDKVDAIARVMVRLQQANGLTWGLRNYPVMQLADNAEVYAGFRAAADIMATVYRRPDLAAYYQDRAARVQAGILTKLYNTATGVFDINLGISNYIDHVGRVNFDYWYDNRGISALIPWPGWTGVVRPTSVIARAQIEALNSHATTSPNYPDWATRTDFAAVGYAALLAGDTVHAGAQYATITANDLPPATPHNAVYTVPEIFTAAEAGFLLRMAAPAATDDTATATGTLPVAIDVGANDYRITAFTAVTYRVATPPAHGTVSISPTGVAMYVPLGGPATADRFTYTVTNGDGMTNTAVVTINPTPVTFGPATLPVAQAGTAVAQRFTAAEGTSAVFNYRVNPGDALPPGVTLSRDGALGGTPTTAGVYAFKVLATTDDLMTVSRQYTWQVTAAAVVQFTAAGPPGPTVTGVAGATLAVPSAVTLVGRDRYGNVAVRLVGRLLPGVGGAVFAATKIWAVNPDGTETLTEQTVRVGAVPVRPDGRVAVDELCERLRLATQSLPLIAPPAEVWDSALTGVANAWDVQ